MAGGMIDVHFHMIPEFYRDAVYEAGTGPAIGRYPDWSPQLALELMDRHGIAFAMHLARHSPVSALCRKARLPRSPAAATIMRAN